MTQYYCDGSGWNGVSSMYCVTDGKKIVKHVVSDKSYTNNMVEYRSVIAALKLAKSGDTIYTDSQVIQGQLCLGWKINQKHLHDLWSIARKLMAQTPNIEIIWIRREYNHAGKELDMLRKRERKESGPREFCESMATFQKNI